MNKLKATVSALSLISATASAQSNVTLYGVLDVPIEFVTHMASSAPTVNPTTGAITQQSGGNRVSLLASGGMAGPRWGMRGSEDLGGGLKAIFAMESGFGVDDGKSQQSGRLFGRQAFVGVESQSLGTLTFGRQYTSMFDAFQNFGPLTYAATYEPLIPLVGSNFREDNMLKYSGVFGGLKAAAHWSFGAGAGASGTNVLAGGGAGEVPGHFRDNTAYGGTLIYGSGPLGLSVAYDQWNPAVTTGNAGRVRKAGAAVSYALGPVKLMAGYRWGNSETSSGTTLLRDDMFWTGAQYQATSSLMLKLGYYYDNVKTLRVGAAAPAVNPANPWQVSFVADYELSKRTDLYLATAYAKNSGLNFDTSANGFQTGYWLSQGSDNQFGAAIGIRHKF